jgi:hypothetical protein
VLQLNATAEAGAATRKLLDVEDVVVWAAGELARKRPGNVAALPVLGSKRDRELVGRWARPMGHPPISPIFALGLGTRGARGDPPHADALIVEAAIGETARILAAPGAGRALAQGAGLAAGLGFRLDAEGAIAAAAANVGNLLLVHGRLASRPLIRLDPPEVSAKLADNGKPGVWRRETWAEPTWGDHAEASRAAEVPVRASRKNLYPPGAYGRLEYAPDPQETVNERAEYWVWRAGLSALAEALSGRMESRTALPPRAAARPWLGERDGGAVGDLFAPGAPGVYGAEEAARLQGDREGARRRPVYGGSVYRGRPVKPGRSLEQEDG